ncbi:alkaline phosphatase family protein [Lutibaculum baratangense]|uniref:Nucleotide pyrophosphatase n=1 Tax=Lutibaculum baratangense AMV1 TaxID=631454 RepID=V4RHX6_9HYPH|nr:alkaline phosphatase family protein [Lutibaculum baratangense]ESR24914.1 hypothetical protein N177_2237 [Lutibaculum baratangense AMV1]
MARIVAIMLDGLRRDLLRPDTTPSLARFAERAESFANHRSVFPSCTRVVSAAFATGCHPRRNGLPGNTCALMEDGRLRLHDVGVPGFFEHRRTVTGRSLEMPTMAERLAGHGGVVVFNNVSPGAASAHDPDGHGHVYHRAGSYGPGRVPLPEAEGLDIAPGIDGDRAMARRFVDEVLPGRAALSVLWLSEPDTTQHAVPLGSAAHLDVLCEADAIAGTLIEAVEELAARGEDVLLIVGSDHGHQTVDGTVDVAQSLVDAGLKAAADSDDVVVAPNGTAALVYVHPRHEDRVAAIAEHLRAQPWAGEVFHGEALAEHGHDQAHGLAIAISMASSEAPNEHGIPGRSFAVKALGTKPDRDGCGQHGGLGTYEQSPVLMIAGRGFRPGVRREPPSSIVDIAPTCLAHLGLAAEDLDGRPLQTDHP